ncbi:MAG: hypothetical protein GY807_18480, partial [Gammaproteobacteria bacterium]|nr:hypothetical protein [Gammaproteobacteria bacterium]
MRRTRSRKRTVAGETTRHHGGHAGPTPPYGCMSDADIGKIIDTSISLLESAGVVFEPGTEADDLLLGAGCEMNPDGIVKIPERVTRDALKNTSRQATLWDRDGEPPITFDCTHIWFMPGMTCIAVYDEQTVDPRPSTREDLAAVT